MRLNEMLNAMYQPHFNELMARLEDDGFIDHVQPPFQLGLMREESGKIAEGDETWYTKADLKVMIFGKEVHEWDPKLENNEKIQSDDLVEAYEQFYSKNYCDQFFRIDSDCRLSKSPFFRTGFNGLMDGVNERLEKLYPEKKAAFLWNNISKLSTRKGRSRKVNDCIHQYELKYYHIIPKEIELLRPDIVIFLTGFGSPYDSYIHENFTVESISAVGDISTNDAIKLKLSEVPLAYKTHHPGTTSVGGRGLNDAERWKHYNAILDDIAENFNRIKGLE